jgi:hypothetical protein
LPSLTVFPGPTLQRPQSRAGQQAKPSEAPAEEAENPLILGFAAGSRKIFHLLLTSLPIAVN